jgi:hypothetical protein
LTNSIAYHNQSPHASNCTGGTLYYSCTMPLPPGGIGNITNAPLFVDAAAGNFRLQSNSPCINAGANAHVPVGRDLDGNRRIVGVLADIGAYEFQSPQSTLPYAWLQHYGLPTDGSADLTDTDADHHNNWQEWQARTDPTNSLSVLRFSNVTPTPLGVVLKWESVAGRVYRIERRTSFSEPPWWWGWWPASTDSFAPLATNIVGQAGTTTFTDTNAIGSATLFYRVGASD